MPDAQGNYLGDQAYVLPSNTQNIMHLSDQYQQANERHALLQQRQEEENNRRQQRLYDVVGNNFNLADYTERNPLDQVTSDAITKNKQELTLGMGEVLLYNLVR